MTNVSEEKARDKGVGRTVEEARWRGWLLSDRAEEFGGLVPIFERRLLRLAINMVGDFHEAQQIVQEAFLRAFKNRLSFRGEASVSTWLSKIVAHLCLDSLRQRRWRYFFRPSTKRDKDNAPGDQEDELAQMGVEGKQYENVLHHEIGRRLRQALEKLSPRQKSVFLLLYVEGLPIVEIGEILGMEPGTVKVQAHRARLQLRKLLPDLAPGRIQEGT